MRAMILAAGLGTRLRPLTLKRPKALIPVANKALMDWNIMYLKAYGVSRIVVNAHHHYEQIVSHIDGGRPFGMDIEVRVEPEILGTGGGIRNTQDFWSSADPFIVVNADILTDIDLHKALEMHMRDPGPATLILHDCDPYNKIQVDDRLDILEIPERTGPKKSGRLAFTGIHIMDPGLLAYIPDVGFSDVIDCYRRLIKEGRPPKAYVSSGHYWRDIGTVNDYIQANRDKLQEDVFLKAEGCRIHETARLEGWAVLGENTVLEPHTEVRCSVLWENAVVKENRKVVNSIVTSSHEVRYDLLDEIS
jgi:mannose-1-phosphate guanylyltransferase